MAAKREIQDMQAGFAGGLNTVADAAVVRPDQARQLENFRLTAYGAATKRGGTKRTSAAPPTASVLTSIRPWPSQNVLMCTTGTTALYWTQNPSAGNTWTTLAATTGTPSDNGVVFTDGTSEFWYTWHTAGLAKTSTITGGISCAKVAGATPAANNALAGLVVYNSRLWGWPGNDGGTTVNRLYYSNLSTAVGSIGGDSFGIVASSGGSIVINTFGQSAIISAVVVGASLMICHQTGVSRLSGFGQDDIDVEPQAVSAEMSILGRDAYAIFQDVAYVLTTQGLMEMTEGAINAVGTPDKPDPTRPVIQSLILGGTSLAGAKVAYNAQKTELYCSLDTVGIYVYNTTLDAWSGPFTGALVPASQNGLCYYAPYAYFGGAGGYLLRMDSSGVLLDNLTSTSTGGTAVTGVLQCHRMFGAERMYSKAWRWITVMCTLTSGGTAPTAVAYSQVSGSSTMTFSAPVSAEAVYYLQPGGVGPYLDVTITDAATNGTNQYVQIGIEGFLLGQR